MDLLASLGLEELPEQQTRMMELMERYPELDARLGFDVCCTCAKELSPESRVPCSLCKRVDYCSEACRSQDARPSDSPTANDSELLDGGEAETAAGHSSIICSLLRLCQDDDDVEAKDANHLDAPRREAAQDRIQSEFESYQATLANAIAEGPCYQPVLTQCSRRTNKRLSLHVIGATVEAELWGQEEDLDTVGKAYAEAVADMVEKKGLSSMEICFIGPDCPSEQNLEASLPIRPTADKTTNGGELTLRTFHGIYNSQLLQDHNIPRPDVVVFFNPGFTVPDYCWTESLACIPKGTPFLSATNTEMEGIADCQFLLDQDLLQTVPLGLAEMLGLYSPPDNDETDDAQGQADRETSFFAVNPFCGTRVRQSGTMGNDLFVKNRWMLGGIMDSYDPSLMQKPRETKKQRTVHADSNTKAANPALI